MVAILDGGSIKQLTQVQFKGEDFVLLKARLTSIKRRLASLFSMHESFCMLCSVIAKGPRGHSGGCPSVFSICFKCLGRHASYSCAGAYFKAARNYCWNCWMPLFDIFGTSFHSNKLEEIGHGCRNEARNFMKPLVCCFFYRREIAGVECPCVDIPHYQRWLFEQSPASTAGSGQMPNILFLLEAVFKDWNQ